MTLSTARSRNGGTGPQSWRLTDPPSPPSGEDRHQRSGWRIARQPTSAGARKVQTSTIDDAGNRGASRWGADRRSPAETQARNSSSSSPDLLDCLREGDA